MSVEQDKFFPFEGDAERQRGLKICGMKHQENILAVAALQPDYLGFIFYEKSARFFDGEIPDLPKNIKKVGVFVDASVEYILKKVIEYDLQAVQLHGNESPEFCEVLLRHPVPKSREYSGSHQTEIIKVFSIKDTFNFSVLKAYEEVCDYFLFDTKGKKPGGNGYTFNWEVLKEYPSTKPYFLSGGIGLEEVDNILSFLRRQPRNFGAKYCYAIDVNSKFEIKPGLKDIDKLKEFKKNLSFLLR